MPFIIGFLLVILFFYWAGRKNYKPKTNDRQMTGIIIQCFDSMHILKTTKKLDTFKSRYELFKEKHAQIIGFKTNWKFNLAFNNAVNKYNEMYYDRPLNGTIKDAEFEPNNFENDFNLQKWLINCLKESIKDDYKKINELKTEKAKQNRLEKINLKIDEYLLYLESQGYKKNDDIHVNLVNIKEAP